ncbi:beta-ketoacyl-ACP reductase [Pseudenhygromyxa sp. WMMC2535]|uniref:beta-ketoacyl-ACP reductase n=1 Tax=Pseudenhygromyxa sp. WMMC2535 TaxID=2712867 RepID=UPI001554D576|nr:beta-ketoacyl-ACP reductase [Pseudenhygromyxa sp. WMMC2535]NVB43316.1 beta-ketoacyl-ACP reductase [Pseudenhygromyxa sp. WMMC2535]
MNAASKRVAIITGAANGIGLATAQEFASAGYHVVAWDLAEEAGKALVAEISEAGGTAEFQSVDVSKSEAVDAAVAKIIEAHGRVDVLVNNAGILRDGQLVKAKGGEVVKIMSDEQFDAVISVNLKGVFNCTRAVTPHMIAAKYGRILNASSVVGLYGNFGQTNYVAAKSGVIGMTKVWARELGRYGITVNAVAPGFIATAMVKQMPDHVLQGMVSHTPVGRIGEPVDIARAYVFLASENSGFISGTTLSVDGGMVVGS